MPIPKTVMRERCAGCAFRSGTEANRSELTQATVRLCLLAGEPFRCHEGDGGSSEHLCHGWVDAFEVQMTKDVPEWKRAVARAMLAALDGVKERHDAGLPYDDSAFLEQFRETLEKLEPAP